MVMRAKKRTGKIIIGVCVFVCALLGAFAAGAAVANLISKRKIEKEKANSNNYPAQYIDDI